MKYDCIVIGSGPAGFYSALSCAKNGYRTAIIESEYLGGTGFRTGCLPVKRNLDILRKTSEAVALSNGELKLSETFYKNLLSDTQKHISGVENIIRKRLTKAGIDIFKGIGEFIDKKTFKLKNSYLKAEYFIIATGTSPAAPYGIAIDGNEVISHTEALTLKTPPEKIIIIGGNVEGMEMASLFSALGTETTIIEMSNQVLKGTDRDLVKPVIEELVSRGTNIITGSEAISVDLSGEKAEVILDTMEKIVGDKIVVTGIREMNIPKGMETTGVLYSKKGIHVNDKLQTNIPNIFAAGDINGLHGMAHVAIQQGILITDGLEGKKVTRDYGVLPRAMFTTPEIAGAGKQEFDLTEADIPYTVRKYDLSDTWRGFSRNFIQGIIKLIFDKRDILIGIWMTGADASEIMTSSGLLIGQKISETTLIDNLFIHPSLGEGITEALFIN